ncbi:hypothetical protein BJ170DRAFT_351452 [Xylariales sp. AK1849]|nr:hypothetical protein BJ170DRAFT_351452 [Xylariales sp. AK1849]
MVLWFLGLLVAAAAASPVFNRDDEKDTSQHVPRFLLLYNNRHPRPLAANCRKQLPNDFLLHFEQARPFFASDHRIRLVSYDFRPLRFRTAVVFTLAQCLATNVEVHTCLTSLPPLHSSLAAIQPDPAILLPRVKVQKVSRHSEAERNSLGQAHKNRQ